MTLSAVWDGLRDTIADLDVVKDRGGSLVFRSRVKDPIYNQHKANIFIEHQSSGRADETKRMNTFQVSIQVKGLSITQDYGRDPDIVANRVCDLAEAIQTGLEENTIDGRVVGGCMMGSTSPITGLSGDPLVCGCAMLANCLTMKHPDAEPELTRLWRIYVGTQAFDTGAYTDVTDWTLLCKGLGALRHVLPYPTVAAPKNATKWLHGYSYAIEERHLTALVQKSTAVTWGMYLGKTIADDESMPFQHVGNEFIELPKYALLLMNCQSDGSFWKGYFPRMSCIPSADVSDKAPWLTLDFAALGDEDNLDTDSELIIGHAAPFSERFEPGPWTD